MSHSNFCILSEMSKGINVKMSCKVESPIRTLIFYEKWGCRDQCEIPLWKFFRKKSIYETNLKKKTICETNLARGSAREKFESFTPILRKFWKFLKVLKGVQMSNLRGQTRNRDFLGKFEVQMSNIESNLKITRKKLSRNETLPKIRRKSMIIGKISWFFAKIHHF